MTPLTIAVFAGLLAQTLAAPTYVVPHAPDLAIKTRQTSDLPNSPVTTETVYFKGPRLRRDTLEAAPARVGGSRLSTVITQCDTRRTLVLNEAAMLYASSPVENLAEELKRFRLAGADDPRPDTAMPFVTITIDTVDTGERRPAGPYVARHIRTTTKAEPGPLASTHASTRVQDGWYVDLPTSCWDWGDNTPIAFGLVVPASGHDRMHVVRRGAARLGHPIEEIDRRTDEGGVVTVRRELVELSEAPLAAALFEVPAGYSSALPELFGGYDLTKPDTLKNRLASYWAGVTSWVFRLFR